FPLNVDAALIDPALKDKHASVIIWTTTPWTLPANLAIAFNPNIEYSAVETEEQVYIVASELVDTTASKCGFRPGKILARFPGSRLENLHARHPFLEKDSLFVLGDHVTLDQGTGCVHTAPGHGQEDYLIGRAYGLEIYCPVDGRGRFITGTPFVEGL